MLTPVGPTKRTVEFPRTNARVFPVAAPKRFASSAVALCNSTSSLDDKPYTRDDWAKRAKWTLDAVDALLHITSSVFDSPVLNYIKNYIAIAVGGNNYMRMYKRSQNKSLLKFRIVQDLQDKAAALLDAQNITFVRKPNRFSVTVDKGMIEKNADVFTSIAALVKKSWQAA